MATFKCKMCGGALEIQEGLTVIECEYCGTKQTLPKLDDERRANLYDRANHFRRNNEFDKASAIYEQILSEGNQDAEAYWSLVLCRYGIEYVEDPSTQKRLPTVNRAQYTSIFDDDNYKSALKYADISQKAVYEAEARAINEIQKGILAISQKEEPFDVFICYKETDNSGKRTRDSVLANDLYHHLTQEGFKVFFSRITLEDKLGSAYEPYIFAALNSAKVMVVLGTKSEFFNAVWVKNEWSRYLSLIKNGAKKVLIPAYKDMDPYDLPEEFSHLQAQDMSKLGFMQDLIRGIKKIVQADTPKTTVIKETVVASNNSSVAPLLKRVFIFLEDGDWDSADEYCEKVLDIDPECAEAYLGKLMAELKVNRQEDLENQSELFDSRNNYKKAFRFADDKLKESLLSYIKQTTEIVKHERIQQLAAILNYKIQDEKAKEQCHNRAKEIMSSANTEEEYEVAARIFDSLNDYKNSKELATECRENAKKAAILSDAKRRIEQIDKSKKRTEEMSEFDRKYFGVKPETLVEQYDEQLENLKSIYGWEGVDEQIEICERKRNEVIDSIDPIYFDAKSKVEEGDTANAETAKAKYEEAITLFESLKGWKDSEEQIKICKDKIKDAIYSIAKLKMEEGNTPNAETAKEKFEEAIGLFKSIKYWKDANEQREICENKLKEINEIVRKDRVLEGAKKRIASIDINSENATIKYNQAIRILESIKGWKDADDQILLCMDKIKQRKNNQTIGGIKLYAIIFAAVVIIAFILYLCGC